MRTMTAEKTGSATTPEEVFEQSGRDMYRVLFAFTGGRRQVAEDAVAESFARAIPRWDSIRDPRAWLFRTAFRCASKEMKGRQPPVEDDSSFLQREDLTDVIRALRTISPRQRAAIVLHFEMDLPVAEVADRLGISPTTASVHIYRGRQRLAAMLGESKEENDV